MKLPTNIKVNSFVICSWNKHQDTRIIKNKIYQIAQINRTTNYITLINVRGRYAGWRFTTNVTTEMLEELYNGKLRQMEKGTSGSMH